MDQVLCVVVEAVDAGPEAYSDALPMLHVEVGAFVVLRKIATLRQVVHDHVEGLRLRDPSIAQAAVQERVVERILVEVIVDELLEGMEGERVDEGGIVRHDIKQDVRYTPILERQGQSIAVARLVDASHRTEAVQRVCGEDTRTTAPDPDVDLSDGLGDGLPVHARAIVPDKGVPHGLPIPPFPQVDVRKTDLYGTARLIGARDGKHKGE